MCVQVSATSVAAKLTGKLVSQVNAVSPLLVLGRFSLSTAFGIFAVFVGVAILPAKCFCAEYVADLLSCFAGVLCSDAMLIAVRFPFFSHGYGQFGFWTVIFAFEGRNSSLVRLPCLYSDAFKALCVFFVMPRIVLSESASIFPCLALAASLESISDKIFVFFSGYAELVCGRFDCAFACLYHSYLVFLLEGVVILSEPHGCGYCRIVVPSASFLQMIPTP